MGRRHIGTKLTVVNLRERCFILRFVVKDYDTFVLLVVNLLDLCEVDHSIVPFHENQVTDSERECFLARVTQLTGPLVRHDGQSTSKRRRDRRHLK